MVIIDIDDEVWEAVTRAWALLGSRSHDALVKFLENRLWEECNDILDDGEKITQ